MTGFRSALYRGELMHARHDHIARRAFTYGVYMAVLDLDELPALDRQLRLFSHRGRNLFSFDERDYSATLSTSQDASPYASYASPDASTSPHGTSTSTSTRTSTTTSTSTPTSTQSTRTTQTTPTHELLEGLAALRAGNGLPIPQTTRLVTNLKVAGYLFNPVSFFIDYDAGGAITSAIAEVNNTYGGRFRYVLGPAQRIPGARVGFRHVRELFVSPFLHGAMTYDFWLDAPLDGPEITVEMHVTRGDKRVLTARFGGTRSPLGDRTLAAAALRYPWMTAQVIGLIHFEAIKMRLGGVPYRRPDADQRPLPDPDTLR